MGDLNRFDLGDYISKYGLSVFVETGTYFGDGVHRAMQFDFKEYYSIELITEYFIKARERFIKEKLVRLINNNSVDGLREVMRAVHKDDRILYWLDAHLPNRYQSKYIVDYIGNKKILIPLEQELLTISSSRDISNDVFIIDDLRIYEDGEFTRGAWPDVIDAGAGGIGFIYNILGNTHVIKKLYDDEGYVLCTPKNKEMT